MSGTGESRRDDVSATSTGEVDGSRARLTLRGDVDVVTAPALREQALDLLQPPLSVVDVDLSGCTFLDSAGIALLGALWARARELGAELVLRDPPTNVRVVLTIAGLAGLLEETGPPREEP